MIKKQSKIMKKQFKSQKTRYEVGIPLIFVEALEITDETECVQELDMENRRIVLKFVEVAK